MALRRRRATADDVAASLSAPFGGVPPAVLQHHVLATLTCADVARLARTGRIGAQLAQTALATCNGAIQALVRVRDAMARYAHMMFAALARVPENRGIVLRTHPDRVAVGVAMQSAPSRMTLELMSPPIGGDDVEPWRVIYLQSMPSIRDQLNALAEWSVAQTRAYETLQTPGHARHMYRIWGPFGMLPRYTTYASLDSLLVDQDAAAAYPRLGWVGLLLRRAIDMMQPAGGGGASPSHVALVYKRALLQAIDAAGDAVNRLDDAWLAAGGNDIDVRDSALATHADVDALTDALRMNRLDWIDAMMRTLDVLRRSTLSNMSAQALADALQTERGITALVARDIMLDDARRLVDAASPLM